MENFRDYYDDKMMEPAKTAVIAYGRYNPPSIGHQQLIDKVYEVASRENADGFIVPTHTHNNKKDPLTFDEKAAILTAMSGDMGGVSILKEGKTLIMLLQHLQKRGYKNIIHIAGSDRMSNFESLIGAYNGKPDKKGNVQFQFDDYTMESSGDRDPDSDGVEGMSASKLRQLAIDNNIDEFKQGMSDKVEDSQKENIFNIIRERLQ
jgi:hypothetical protein